MPQSQEDQDRRRKLLLAKGVVGMGQGLAHGKPEKALAKALSLGSKLASSIFYDNNVNIITLLKELHKFGPEILLKTPETLFAMIDKQYGNKTNAQAADDIVHFHETGELRTDVPILVRNKIYAIRTASMSDAPYVEWNIFEKVGGAFNGRVANFSHLEPMSSGECAVTVALLDAIRQDTFANEVKIYVATCCHQDGLYTVDPVDELAMAEPYLKRLNEDSSGTPRDPAVLSAIKAEYVRMKADLSDIGDDLAHVQAGKLLGAQLMAEEALHGSH
jgi:hypothetical protein